MFTCLYFYMFISVTIIKPGKPVASNHIYYSNKIFLYCSNIQVFCVCCWMEHEDIS